jgi:hypothetical protein
VEFAFQLCREFAAAEASDRELSAALGNACEMLERIMAHNALLKCSDCRPTWPRHTALLRFDFPLYRLTKYFLFAKKWKPCSCVLRGRYLLCYPSQNPGCCSSRGSVHPEQTSMSEDALAWSNMMSRDGRYCVDVQGMRAYVTSASFMVDGQSFIFEIVNASHEGQRVSRPVMS